jgi:hypothetical protein
LGGDTILKVQDFVTGALKIWQKIETHVPRFPERKILFAPLQNEFGHYFVDFSQTVKQYS